MTSYALLYDPGPSGILPGAATMPITGGGLTAGPSTTGDTIVQANAGAPMAAGSGCFCWSVQVGSASLTGYSGPGFISDTYSSTNAMCVGAVQCNVMLTNGSFYAAGGAPFYSPGLATGDTFDFAVNLLCSPPLVWLRRTASGAGSAGQWNGNSTAAPSNSPSATASGTGGFAISSVTFPIVVAVCFNNGANASYTFNFGASSYTWPMPSGFSNVPPNPVLEITSILSTVGSPTQIGWADTNGGTASGLNYSLNGGAFTACGGTVSGTSGTATGPTIGSNGANSLVLQDAANPLNCTAKTWFPALTTPSGAGTLLASTAFSITQPGSLFSITGSLLAANATILFQWGMNEVCSVTGTTNGAPSLSLGGEDSGSQTFNTTFSGFWTATDGTPGQQDGVSGPLPTTGPASVPISLATSVTGTLSVAGGHFNATINNNGTTVTYVNDSGSGVYNTWEIGFGVMYPSVPAVTMTTYLGVWAPLAPETLSITSASYSDELLSIGGACLNATLTALNISTNGGAAFTDATSLTVSGTSYLASLAGSLANGTYILQTEDATTDVVSNLYTFSLEATETLTLSTGSLTSAGTLALTGNVTNAELYALNISSNGGTSFTGGALSTSGTNWSATDGILSAGTYTLQAQDAVTGVLSNTLPLTVSGETISLTSLTGTVGGLLSFGGTTASGTSIAMDFNVNGTWLTPTSYSHSGSTFSGTGGTITAFGTYVGQVRDHTNQYVISNAETLVVVPAESITLTTVGGTFGGPLSLAGVTNGAVPAGLNVTLSGGYSYQPTSGYSNAGSSTASAWTASSVSTISAGTYTINVQDSVYPSIISNSLTLVVDQPAETIILASAAGVDGALLSLTGTTANGPAPGLQLTLDGGATWSSTGSYSTSNNTMSAPWTALGPIMSPGGYVIEVRDSSDTAVVSNAITLVVPSSSGTTSTVTGTSFGLSPNGRTLFLNPATWDLVLDTDGNIAVANDPYATAQDVSSAIRLFLGELWYNSTAGVPYFSQILGQIPSIPFIAQKLQAAALSVPTVVSATAVITAVSDRSVTGQMQFVQSNGVTQTVSIQ